MKQHFVIIGGGIIGTTIARALAKRNAGQITVLEKESTLGFHASGRNSGVIHSGINQKPGSIKARMCVQGNRLLKEYCRGKNVPMAECGTLVAAKTKKELSALEELKQLGTACGVEGLEIISDRELQKREPAISGIAALLSPSGAVVDSLALLQSLADDAIAEGVQYHFDHKVEKIDGRTLFTSHGEVVADYIINCAGLYTDQIAHMMNAGLGYRIIPFRGEYYEVKNCDIRSMVYRIPDLRFPFLSVHLTRETNGQVLAGPSAVLAFGRESYEKEWEWKETFHMLASRNFIRMVMKPAFIRLAYQNAAASFSKHAFLNQVRSLAPSVTQSQLVPARAGIRAQMVDQSGCLVKDILIERQERAIHILNAVSPGMTCSLPFAEMIIDQIFGDF